MSELHHRLITSVPSYVPEAPAREVALERLKSFVSGARQVTAEVYEHIELVPAISNFETVSCPIRGAVLDDAWWVQAMDAAYSESGFTDLRVTVPCCGAATSLNDLTYHFSRGFARFVLSAFEPPVADLEDWQVREREALVGCALRKIWVNI
jgi:hypothetical protein